MRRVVHIHVPKTAGTSLKVALRARFPPDRVFRGIHEADFAGIDPSRFDFFSAHIGMDLARTLDAPIVSVFRDPVDRFVSVYYYWRELYRVREGQTRRGPAVAHELPLEEFVERFDEPALVEEFLGRMTWQMAHSHLVERREEIAGTLDRDQLLARALDNIEGLAVVGFQDDLDTFAARCEARLGITLALPHRNTTPGRPAVDRLDPALVGKIRQWLELDIELYALVRERFGPAGSSV